MPRPVATTAAMLAALAAGSLWWRRHPSACPYGGRFLLELPRPGLTAERLRDALSPRPGERVLEVGPGSGHFTLPIAADLEPRGELTGLDLQPAMLEHVARRAAEQGVANVVLREGDATRLPFADGLFDAAFLVTVLGEIPDQAAAVRELARVLRPGGRLVVGEIVLDPHYVSLGSLQAHARAAGLSFRRRVGTPAAFYARFDRPL